MKRLLLAVAVGATFYALSFLVFPSASTDYACATGGSCRQVKLAVVKYKNAGTGYVLKAHLRFIKGAWRIVGVS